MTNQQGGGTGPTTETRLTSGTVRSISDDLSREAGQVSRSELSSLALGAVHFGGSDAGQRLGGHYEGAFADAITQTEDTVTMLQDYAVNLDGSAQDTEDTDTLNATALRQIGNFDPGRD